MFIFQTLAGNVHTWGERCCSIQFSLQSWSRPKTPERERGKAPFLSFSRNVFMCFHCFSGTSSSPHFGPTRFITCMASWCWSWWFCALLLCVWPSCAHTSSLTQKTTGGKHRLVNTYMKGTQSSFLFSIWIEVMNIVCVSVSLIVNVCVKRDRCEICASNSLPSSVVLVFKSETPLCRQWTSFLSAASTAVYVYMYSFYYYFFKTK